MSRRLHRLAAGCSCAVWFVVAACGGNSNHQGLDAMSDSARNDAAVDAAIDVAIDAPILKPWAQQSYVKASNANAGDRFGSQIALSSDGSTLAVGAYQEASAATGVGGNQADNSATQSGAVYVFVRVGATWTQQGYIKASNTDAGDFFGGWYGTTAPSLALSSDGSTLVVGAAGEASAATGVGGNQADNSATHSGAVYVFTRVGSTWTQQAYIKASNSDGEDKFGASLALSSDGSTLAVGAYNESSAATGVGGNQTDNSAAASGAVYMFTRSSATWTQQAYIKASNTDRNDLFGCGVALSSDGSTLAVGAPNEASAATGVGGDQADNSAVNSGAVYVFTRAVTTWNQQAYVKASNTRALAQFGTAVTLSSDGSTLAVGAWNEDSAATGVGGNQADNSAATSGAAYVFTRVGSAWTQQAYVKASNTNAGDRFGVSAALSSDGSTLVVGAFGEASAATGVDGNQADNSAVFSGAVYVFKGSGVTWAQHAYIKASNTDLGDDFGTIALSADGGTLAVGAFEEDSAATGIDGNQADNSASESGAVYVFRAQ